MAHWFLTNFSLTVLIRINKSFKNVCVQYNFLTLNFPWNQTRPRLSLSFSSTYYRNWLRNAAWICWKSMKGDLSYLILRYRQFYCEQNCKIIFLSCILIIKCFAWTFFFAWMASVNCKSQLAKRFTVTELYRPTICIMNVEISTIF